MGMKPRNIITGLTNSARDSLCIWCDVTRVHLKSCGTLKTSASCHSNYNNWHDHGDHGGVKKQAKDFKNCVNLPLFYADDDEIIFDVMPPRELHLLLVCVNKLYSSRLELHPDATTKCNNFRLQEMHVMHYSTILTNFSTYTFVSARELVHRDLAVLGGISY